MTEEAPTTASTGLPLPFRLFVLVLLLGTAAGLPDGFAHAVDEPVGTLVWIAALAAASLLSVTIMSDQSLDVSLSAPVSVAGAVVFEPTHAALIAFVGSVSTREFQPGTSLWLVAFNRSQLAWCAGVASLGAHLVTMEGTAGLILGTLAAGVIHNVVNAGAVAVKLVLHRGERLPEAARESAAPFKQFVIDYGLVIALALLVVIAFQPLGHAAVLLIALPVWLGYNALKSGREAQDRAEQLAAQVEDLERLTARLREAQAARESLSTQVLQEGATERSRIALDLHDVVLPFLAAAEIQADNISSALEAGEEEIAARLAAATRDAVHSSIASIRQTLEDLRNQTTAPGELRQRITKLLNEMNVTHGLATHLDAPEDLSALPAAVEIVLADTLRGLLSNVARHAEAQKVSVHLSVEEHRVLLEVEDDGKGFEVGDRMQQGGHGLALLQQRVALARGRVRVRSQPGEGTTVSVEVPL